MKAQVSVVWSPVDSLNANLPVSLFVPLQTLRADS